MNRRRRLERHHDLLTVGQAGSEVDRGEVGFGQRPGQREQIGDTGSGGQLIDARVTNRPARVDDDRRGGGNGARAGAGRRRGDRRRELNGRLRGMAGCGQVAEAHGGHDARQHDVGDELTVGRVHEDLPGADGLQPRAANGDAGGDGQAQRP